MKKIWLFTTLLFGSLLLVWCNCNCNVSNDCASSELETNEAKKICLENKWTYSRVTESDGEHGECMFPSGIGCRDEMVLGWECNWKANVDDIDTEEERFAQCKENVTGWFPDMMEGAVLNDVEYWDEEEIIDEDWNLSMINREFKAKYTRDWQNWILDWVCEANFVQWGMWTTFNQEHMVVRDNDY